MATPTYDLIASNVLSSSASSVTFSSIPATYRDLIVVVSGVTSTNAYQRLRLNATTTPYSFVYMVGTGSTTFSGSGSDNCVALNYYDSTSTAQPAPSVTQIFDYAQTDKHKTCLVRNGQSDRYTEARATRWGSTDAVSSIEISVNTGTYNSGSTFYLYGIVS